MHCWGWCLYSHFPHENEAVEAFFDSLRNCLIITVSCHCSALWHSIWREQIREGRFIWAPAFSGSSSSCAGGYSTLEFPSRFAFSLVHWVPSPWDGAARVQGRSSHPLVNSLWRSPHRHTHGHGYQYPRNFSSNQVDKINHLNNCFYFKIDFASMIYWTSI